MRGHFLGRTLLAVSISAAPIAAQALDMKINGNTIMLSGAIRSGDEFAFKELIESPAGQKVRIVRVNSGGGFVYVAGEIARLIRKRGLATLLDARSGRCASACTLLFAGGVARHFANGQAIQDGIASLKEYRGLAFHEGSSALSVAANGHSGQATAHMVGFFYEFGVGSARNLITKAPPNRVYQISGPTALTMGIATSTSMP